MLVEGSLNLVFRQLLGKCETVGLLKRRQKEAKAS